MIRKPFTLVVWISFFCLGFAVSPSNATPFHFSDDYYLEYCHDEGTHIPYQSQCFLNDHPLGGPAAWFHYSHHHYAFTRDGHIFFDDRDLGEGSDPHIYDDHIIFNQSIDSQKVGDIVFDGQVVGHGKYPAIYGTHFAFCQQAESGFRVVKDGQDLGEGCLGSGQGIQLSQGHIVYTVGANDHPHIIFDGHDIGEGESILLAGDHLSYHQPAPSYAWVRDGDVIGVAAPGGIWVQGDHYAVEVNHQIIHDGRRVGPGHGPAVYGNHLAYFRGASPSERKGVRHVIYDGKDMGLGRVFIQLAGDHIVFDRTVNGKTHIILDGQDIGEGRFNQFGLAEDYRFDLNP